MKKLLSAAAVAIVLSLPFSASAANEYRVVDMQQVLKDAKAAQSVRQDIDGILENLKKYISGKEDQLRTANKSLDENRNILSPDEFKQKQTEFRQKVVSVQEEVQKKRAELEKVRTEALVTIQNAVVGIIDDMSKREGFDMALPKSQVLYHKAELDITPQVVAALDKKLPKVNVSLPK
jgi:outer membrane protein